MPTLGPMYVNRAYFWLFAAPGYWGKINDDSDVGHDTDNDGDNRTGNGNGNGNSHGNSRVVAVVISVIVMS